jgi:hypothetical protein
MRRDVRAERGDAAPDNRATLALGSGGGFRQMLRRVRSPGRLQTCLDKLVCHQRAFEGRVRHGFFRLGEQAVPDRDRSRDLFDRLLRTDFSTGRWLAMFLMPGFGQDGRPSVVPGIRWHTAQISSSCAG